MPCERGIEPNIITYTTLINGLCLIGKWEEVFRVFKLMILKGHKPNSLTYNIYLSTSIINLGELIWL